MVRFCIQAEDGNVRQRLNNSSTHIKIVSSRETDLWFVIKFYNLIASSRHAEVGHSKVFGFYLEEPEYLSSTSNYEKLQWSQKKKKQDKLKIKSKKD